MASGNSKRSMSLQLAPLASELQKLSKTTAPVVSSRRHSMFLETSKIGASKLKDRQKKKGGGGTPDKPATPCNEAEENLLSQKTAIWNEEIEKLQLKNEDLSKVWPPRPPLEERKQPTVMSYSVKKLKRCDEVENKTKTKQIKVAKPAPPDAPIVEPDFEDFAGPRFDSDGNVIRHSILGSYEDFHREALRRGQTERALPEPGLDDRTQTPTVKYEKKKRPKTAHRTHDENKALTHWQTRMMERKRQQGHISKLLQKAPEDLAMSQGDKYRAVQERRYLIDRTIPKIDYGKGFRIGSEFWNQQLQLGDDLRGIHMTLTQTEKGYPPPIEHVGLSQTAKQEKGCEWLGRNTPHLNYPWHHSEYLQRRTSQLHPFMKELDPFTPEFEDLQVIGSNKPQYFNKADNDEEEDKYLNNTEREPNPEPLDVDKLVLSEPSEAPPTTEEEPIENQPVFGPSLLIAGQAARWTGDSFSYKDQIGMETRLSFESLTETRLTSFLELVNDGTTSVFYSWTKVHKENPFDLVKQEVHRFYFDASDGVLLPGDTIKYPVVFKSPNAGVFTEKWLFETRPVLCGGAALLVTFRGVAIEEDKYKDEREEIEKDLQAKQAHQIVSQVLYELVSGIRTPERSRSPIDAYITEEEIFTRNNPGIQYKHDQVKTLKEIFAQLFDEEYGSYMVWNLTIKDLKQGILAEEDEEKQESLLQQLNAVLGKMTYLPVYPRTETLIRTGYNLFVEAADRIATEAVVLRQNMNLQLREQDAMEPPGRGESRKGRSTADRSKSELAKDKPKQQTPSKDTKPTRSKENTKTDLKGKTTPSGGGGKKSATPVKSPQTPSASTLVDREPTQDSNPDESQPDTSEETEKVYKQKLYSQTYQIVEEMLDHMDTMFYSLIH